MELSTPIKTIPKELLLSMLRYKDPETAIGFLQSDRDYRSLLYDHEFMNELEELYRIPHPEPRYKRLLKLGSQSICDRLVIALKNNDIEFIKRRLDEQDKDLITDCGLITKAVDMHNEQLVIDLLRIGSKTLTSFDEAFVAAIDLDSTEILQLTLDKVLLLKNITPDEVFNNLFDNIVLHGRPKVTRMLLDLAGDIKRLFKKVSSPIWWVVLDYYLDNNLDIGNPNELFRKVVNGGRMSSIDHFIWRLDDQIVWDNPENLLKYTPTTTIYPSILKILIIFRIRKIRNIDKFWKQAVRGAKGELESDYTATPGAYEELLETIADNYVSSRVKLVIHRGDVEAFRQAHLEGLSEGLSLTDMYDILDNSDMLEILLDNTFDNAINTIILIGLLLEAVNRKNGVAIEIIFDKLYKSRKLFRFNDEHLKSVLKYAFETGNTSLVVRTVDLNTYPIIAIEKLKEGHSEYVVPSLLYLIERGREKLLNNFDFSDLFDEDRLRILEKLSSPIPILMSLEHMTDKEIVYDVLKNLKDGNEKLLEEIGDLASGFISLIINGLFGRLRDVIHTIGDVDHDTTYWYLEKIAQTDNNFLRRVMNHVGGHLMNKALKKRQMDLVEKLVKLRLSTKDYDEYFRYAIENNDVELLEIILKNDVREFNDSLLEVLEGVKDEIYEVLKKYYEI